MSIVCVCVAGRWFVRVCECVCFGALTSVCACVYSASSSSAEIFFHTPLQIIESHVVFWTFKKLLAVHFAP